MQDKTTILTYNVVTKIWNIGENFPFCMKKGLTLIVSNLCFLYVREGKPQTLAESSKLFDFQANPSDIYNNEIREGCPCYLIKPLQTSTIS
jgi:hypothetical protein